MRDDRLRAERASLARTARHVAPLNALVDQIGTEQGVQNLPLIDPTFGGADATVLFVLKAPEGDATPDRPGARFLSLDNDDLTAVDFFSLTQEAGLKRSSICPWNICPFPIEGAKATVGEVRRASAYHRRLFALLPNLRAIVLFGDSASAHWKHVPYRGNIEPLTCHLPSRWNRPDHSGVPRNPESWSGIQVALAAVAEVASL
ncbi:hypothetical protein REA19_16670 [Prescottella equi]|nr:hypothetical protein REA19_16670 [Prescottella equi]